MVKPHARAREIFVGVVAAGATTFHIGETKCVLRSAPQRGKINEFRRAPASLPPKTYCTDSENHQAVKRDQQRRYGHRDKRDDAVKGAFAEMDGEQIVPALEQEHQKKDNQ